MASARNVFSLSQVKNSGPSSFHGALYSFRFSRAIAGEGVSGGQRIVGHTLTGRFNSTRRRNACPICSQDAVKIMARDLVRTRRQVKKFILMRANIQAVSLKIQTLRSQNAMAQAMKGVTRAMQNMNRQVCRQCRPAVARVVFGLSTVSGMRFPPMRLVSRTPTRVKSGLKVTTSDAAETGVTWCRMSGSWWLVVEVCTKNTNLYDHRCKR